jgi:hypothetical protein
VGGDLSFLGVLIGLPGGKNTSVGEDTGVASWIECLRTFLLIFSLLSKYFLTLEKKRAIEAWFLGSKWLHTRWKKTFV